MKTLENLVTDYSGIFYNKQSENYLQLEPSKIYYISSNTIPCSLFVIDNFPIKNSIPILTNSKLDGEIHVRNRRLEFYNRKIMDVNSNDVKYKVLLKNLIKVTDLQSWDILKQSVINSLANLAGDISSNCNKLTKGKRDTTVFSGTSCSYLFIENNNNFCYKNTQTISFIINGVILIKIFNFYTPTGAANIIISKCNPCESCDFPDVKYSAVYKLYNEHIDTLFRAISPIQNLLL